VSLTQAIAGFAVFLVTTAGPFLASALAVRRYAPREPLAVRLVASGLFASAAVLLTFLVAIPIGAFRPLPLAAAWTVMTIAAHVAWGRGREVPDDARRLREVVRWLWTSRLRVLVAAGVAWSVGIAAVRALSMPPLSWDTLTYHLYFAGTWVQGGGLFPPGGPDGLDGYSHFPFDGEAFAAWLMMPFHTDVLVNLLNFPFLVLAALAVYALARELGVARGVAAAASAAVVLSPMNFAYVTTAYVDLQVCAEIVAATLFAVRFVKRALIFDAVAASVALGLAVGTKQSALPTAALLGAIFLAVIARGDARGRRRLVAALLAGGVVAVGLGGLTYIHNGVTAGNPLYPLAVHAGGRELFQGSLYQARVFAEKGDGTPRQDLQNLVSTFGYRPSGSPLSAGPKYLVLMALAVCALVLPARATAPKAIRALLAVLWLVPLVSFYLDATPHTVVVRRFWILHTPRFLAPALAICAVLAALMLDRFHGRTRSLVCAALVLIDVPYVNTRTLDARLTWGAAAALAAAAALTVWGSKNVRRTWGAVALAIVAGGTAVFFLTRERDRTRWTYYELHMDLHPTTREFVRGWRWMDGPDSRVVALACGWANSGHNWFYYPLMGRRLQNRVVYASINRLGDVGTHVDRGLLRERGDYGTWRANLARLGVEYVFVQAPPVPELDWMTRRPDEFRLVYQSRGATVFKIVERPSEHP
jgi:hypothetical protein